MVNQDTLQHLISANIEELERARLQQKEEFKALAARYFRRVAGISLVLFLGAGIFFRGGLGIPLMIAASIISMAIAGIALGVYFNKTAAPKQAFRVRVKEEIYKNALAHWYPQMTYYPQKCVAEATYKEAGLFGRHDVYKGDDYLEGTLPNGQALYFSELDVVAEDRDASNNHSLSTVFKGLFFVLELPTAITGTVKILPDTAERGMGKLGVFLQKKLGKFGHTKSELVYFEDYPEFEKEFVVYSDEESAARQLVSPDLIQTLQELKAKTKGVALSFSGQQLYLATSSKKNFLDVDSSIPLTHPSFLSKLMEDLNYSLQLIGHLEHLSLAKAENSTTRQVIPPLKKPLKTSQKSSLNYKKSNSKDNPFLL